jgi:major membrane immunogen (membrane-anchored lipoprotein)
MEKFPKKNIFKTPENYFEQLPDQILEKRKPRALHYYLSGIAAAAMIVLGVFLFLNNESVSDTVNYQAEINQEVEYYIESGIWNVEDVLLLADNPNELLDDVAAEEWSSQEWVNEVLLDDEIFY